MFTHARRTRDNWFVANAWGHELRLPYLKSLDYQEVRFGVLGTRRREPLKRVRSGYTVLMAELLGALACPLYLLDIRRDGTGGQSSWSPREFASVIPAALPPDRPYSYVHLPCLAPSE